MEEQEKKVIEENLKIQGKFKSGANWFFWIAGLSLINSIILLAGGEWSFIVGLGITQIFDTIGLEIAKEAGIIGKILAFMFDLFAAGIFVLFGIFARKKYNWAFIVGMVLYAFDGLLFLLAQDILSIGFHILALYFIYNGLQANKQLESIENNKNKQ